MSTACVSTAITGVNGNVVCDNVRIARITSWTINPSVGETTFGDSDSGLFVQRLPTRRELTGSFEFNVDTTFPQWTRLVEGECCHLVLFHNTTLYWDLPIALLTGLTFNVNVEDLEVQDGSADFSTSGIYYRPGEAGSHSHTLPAGPT